MRTAYKTPGIEIVAINDITDARTLAHLLKYDSTFGIFAEDVSHGDGFIQRRRAQKIKVSAVKNPAELPWKELGIDLVVESTGLFTKRPEAEKHLQAGARKVLISAPATDPDVTIVLGVNDADYDPKKHHIISNASCTTNCVAPLAKVLHDHFQDPQGQHDHHPRLHQRPAHPRPAPQGPAPLPRRRPIDDPHRRPARPRPWDWSSRT